MAAAPPVAITQTPISWPSLVSSNSPALHRESIPFLPPSEEDGELVVNVEDEDCELAKEYWANSIVGYIIGISPAYTSFVQFLKGLWNPKGDFKVLLKGNGFFLVQFNLEEDMLAVLEGGPWTMSNRPFIIRKWMMESRMEQSQLTSISVWIRLPNLPLHLWTPTGIGKVTSAIGTPLFMDTATCMQTHISYATVCVEIEAGQPLCDSISVIHNGEVEHYHVQYEWKPIACSACSTFGHDNAMCGKQHPNLPPKDTLNPPPLPKALINGTSKPPHPKTSTNMASKDTSIISLTNSTNENPKPTPPQASSKDTSNSNDNSNPSLPNSSISPLPIVAPLLCLPLPHYFGPSP
ncbi:hypothetical protein QJS04_geneDACA004225 [Acorus gramineus]|uniref:DUF4283 domain-containing protein n=1 Tax=Acorus gramineus TaxID=55184 RepID=A0AAV9B207_ACOGR|nr:hypothetical protein QJS04_geneDACA004225 [Acorus gramineus]